MTSSQIIGTDLSQFTPLESAVFLTLKTIERSATVVELARVLGVCRRTIRRAIGTLAEALLVTKKTRKGVECRVRLARTPASTVQAPKPSLREPSMDTGVHASEGHSFRGNSELVVVSDRCPTEKRTPQPQEKSARLLPENDDAKRELALGKDTIRRLNRELRKHFDARGQRGQYLSSRDKDVLGAVQALEQYDWKTIVSALKFAADRASSGDLKGKFFATSMRCFAMRVAEFEAFAHRATSMPTPPVQAPSEPTGEQLTLGGIDRALRELPPESPLRALLGGGFSRLEASPGERETTGAVAVYG